MAADGHAVAREDGEPAGPGADFARGVEQAEAVFAGGEAGEAVAAGVVGGDEPLFAVQHRGVGRARVVATAEVKPLQVGDDGAAQRRVRHAVEVVVGEIRHAGLPAKELHERQPVHRARQLPGASFIDAQHRGQVPDGGVVDVEGVGQQLADAGVATGAVHRLRVAGREQQRVGGGAARLVRAEEGADVVAQRFGQGAETGALREGGEGEVHEQVGSPLVAYAVPAVGAGGASEQRERASDAAEGLAQPRRRRKLFRDGKPAALGDERDERFEQLAAVGEQGAALVVVEGASATGDAAGGERLRLGLVAEHVEDARRGGDGRSAEHELDPRSKLLLREELLEGAPAGHDAVALEVDGGVRRLPVEPGRHDEHLAGQRPGGGEDDQAIVRVFDHVDHVAEIHHVGGGALFVGKEGRVPARHGDPHLLQPQQVVPAPAAVVEERATGLDDAVLQRQRHRPRQRVPANGRSVSPHRAHGTIPVRSPRREGGGAAPSRGRCDCALDRRMGDQSPNRMFQTTVAPVTTPAMPAMIPTMMPMCCIRFHSLSRRRSSSRFTAAEIIMSSSSNVRSGPRASSSPRVARSARRT